MIVLVCGSRDWSRVNLIRFRLSQLPKGTVILSGMARGADLISVVVAREFGFDIREFPADWHTYGRAAGPKRNRQMLDAKPELVIAFHENLKASKGTRDCVTEARRRGITVEVIASLTDIKGG